MTVVTQRAKTGAQTAAKTQDDDDNFVARQIRRIDDFLFYAPMKLVRSRIAIVALVLIALVLGSMYLT